MCKKTFKQIQKGLKRKTKGLLAIILTVILTFGLLPLAQVHADETPELPPVAQVDEIVVESLMLDSDRAQAFEEVQLERLNRGLVGFEGESALPNDDTPVYVIVLFEHSPAPVQVLEAQAVGLHMSLEAAEQVVEDEHSIFRSELAALFPAFVPFGAQAPYEINIEFRQALNGVSMRLPAYMVEDVANISVVRAIYPDEAVEPPEVIVEEFDFEEFEASLIPLAGAPNHNPWGMLQGRSAMNANELHAQGIIGEGILIGIIDTGIDWMHPAFIGSFPTAEWMANTSIRGDRAVNISQAELLNINAHRNTGVPEGTSNYVFVGRDIIRLWPGGGGEDRRANPREGQPTPPTTPGIFQNPQTLPAGMPGNNPMEVAPIYFPSRAGLPSWAPNPTNPGFSNHGTHVSGTILGRSVFGTVVSGTTITNPAVSILGVAPGAMGIHYRGLYGWTPNSIIISAIEWAAKDKVDVVNLSLGGMLGASVVIQNVAINNIMLSDPDIVFVISAGNNGTAFYTLGNPGGSSMAITVSSFAETAVANLGLALNSTYGSIENAHLSFLWNTNAGHIQQVDFASVPGRIVFDARPTAPLTAAVPVHNNGEFKIFAMPITAGSGGLPTTPVGAGSEDDFIELENIHGQAALAGHFVLVRRGEAFIAVAQRAAALGLGGIIQINNVAAVPAQTAAEIQAIPFLSMPQTIGDTFATAITQGSPDTHYGTFHFGGDISVPPHLRSLSTFSSAGPVEGSFEIKPEIGAHGGTVFSATTRFTGGAWQTASLNSTGTMSGTSMSAPHVAGAVALMQQYSQENAGGRWSNAEIKTRIMNTAIPGVALGGRTPGLSVFDGARQIDVLAAVKNNTVVSVAYPHVPTVFSAPFEQQPSATTQTGAFSFGGFNRTGTGGGERSGTLTATIQNNSTSAVTYTITHEFMTTTNARMSRNGGSLAFSNTSITVAPGGSQNFTATLTIPATADTGAAAHGFYQGYVIVSNGSEVVARLPFAGVSHYRPATVSNVVTYRPVVTTDATSAQNMTSQELVVSLIATHGFYADLYLIEYNPAVTAANWRQTATILGTTMGTAGHPENRARFFPAHRGVDPTVPIRGVIFDGTYRPLREDSPAGAGTLATLEDEGKYIIVMDIFRQTPNATTATLTTAHAQANNWFWDSSILVPFYVDNTPAVFNSITINSSDVDLAASVLSADLSVAGGIMPLSTDIIVTGNVSDIWTAQAAGNVTFDVWTSGAQAAVGSANNLAVWALAGTSSPTNRPVRATVQANGNFEVTLTDGLAGTIEEITLWLIDGYAPVPVVNQVPIGTLNPGVAAFWNTSSTARILGGVTDYFNPAGFLEVDSVALGNFLREDRIFGHSSSNNTGATGAFTIPNARFNEFVWSGVNMSELTVFLTIDGPFIPTLELDPPVVTLVGTGPNISWPAVEHAQGYRVYVNGVPITTGPGSNIAHTALPSTITFNLETIAPPLGVGGHTITVRALGNPPELDHSELSNAVSFVIQPPNRSINVTFAPTVGQDFTATDGVDNVTLPMTANVTVEDPSAFTMADVLTLQWYRDGTIAVGTPTTVPVPLASGSIPLNHALNPVTLADDGLYTLRVSVGTEFFAVSPAHRVNVVPQAPPVVGTGDMSVTGTFVSAVVDEGDSASLANLTVTPILTSPALVHSISYAVYRDSAQIHTGTLSLTGGNVTFGIPSTVLTDAGSYEIFITYEIDLDGTGFGVGLDLTNTINLGPVTLTVLAPLPPANTPPVITTTTLPSGTEGTAYSQTLAATGTDPITWAIEPGGGALPPGLSLDTATGEIFGTPTVEGTFPFTVRATNVAGSVTSVLSITIAPSVTPPTPVTGVVITGSGVRSMLVGQTLALAAVVQPANATNTSVTWSSNNPSIASVSASGVVTGVSVGTAIITVTTADGGFTATVTINVTQPAPTTQQLPAPVAAISGSVVSWNAVANAAGYRVYVGGTAVSDVITTTTFNLATLGLGIGTHSIQVRAIGTGNFTDSALSNAVSFVIQAAQPPVVGGAGGGQEHEGSGPGVSTPRPTPTPTPQPTLTPAPTPVPTPTPQLPTPPSLCAHQLFDDVAEGSWYHSYVSIVVENGLFQGVAPRTFAPNVTMTRAMFVQAIANLEGVSLAAFAQVSPSFNDVAPGAWYFNAVEWAYEEGIVLGVGEDNFTPNAPITREQMALILHRYAQLRGIELTAGQSMRFTDHDSISLWAVDAVEAMQASGIIAGRPGGIFDPQANATRAEVAAIFARLLVIVR